MIEYASEVLEVIGELKSIITQKDRIISGLGTRLKEADALTELQRLELRNKTHEIETLKESNRQLVDRIQNLINSTQNV